MGRNTLVFRPFPWLVCAGGGGRKDGDGDAHGEELA